LETPVAQAGLEIPVKAEAAEVARRAKATAISEWLAINRGRVRAAAAAVPVVVVGLVPLAALPAGAALASLCLMPQ
jgi:hypothetical protein